MSKSPDDFQEHLDDESLPAYSVLPPDAHNPVEGLIPPRRYQIQHDGFMKGARIWIVDPSTGPRLEPLDTPELEYDSKGSFGTDEKLGLGENSQDANAKADSLEDESSAAETSAQGSSKEKEKKKPKFKLINPSVVPGHYYVKRVKNKTYAFYEGAGPDDQFAGSRKLIDMSGEGFFNKKSSYSEVSGKCRHARMYGVPPWYSCDRELEDFEGNLWLLHTKAPTAIDDIEIKRKSDGADVAFFDRAVWSVRGIGILDVKVPLSPDIFHLMLSAWYVKYDEDTYRRDGVRSSGSVAS